MKKYVFISNSTKPTFEERMSRNSLIVSNVSRPCLETASSMGYEVYLGVNRDRPEEINTDLDFPIKLYDQNTYRNLFAIGDNFRAFKNLIHLLSEGDFDAIHCNTPIGGTVGRVCGKLMGIRKIIYTAHGFHFYKGAPFINRTIIKWAEMIMAHWTDAIITMNDEDYESAKKFKLKKGGKVFKVHGVGINTKLYREISVDKNSIRKTLGLQDDDIICISMGDLIPRKNYETAIKAIAKTPINVHYLICGRGPELDKLKELAKILNIEERIHFLGFRTDVIKLLKISDIFLFTTRQEGLPRSMMEAMSSGLPCIASKIRGNTDLLKSGGGYLVDIEDIDGIAEKISLLASDSGLREVFKEKNLKRIEDFDISNVKSEIEEIYKSILEFND